MATNNSLAADKYMNSKLIDPRTLKVKNTFIEISFDELSRVDDCTGVDDPFGMDEPVGVCRREMTEPMPYTSKLLESTPKAEDGDTADTLSSFFQHTDTDSDSVDGGHAPETDSEPEMQSIYACSDKEAHDSFMAGYTMAGMPWQCTAGMSPYAMWPIPLMGVPLAAYPTAHAMDNIGAEGSWANIYTVMMRNLPNKVTQEQLLSELNGAGFLHTYDFVYLPIDPDTHANRGYAFINFASQGMALMFKGHFEGEKFRSFHSNKVVSVVPATLQGFDANYVHYSSSHVQHRDPGSRPLFLREPATNSSQRWGWQNTESLIDSASGQLRKKQQQQQQQQQQQLLKRQKQARMLPAAAPGGTPADSSEPLVSQFCYSCGGGTRGGKFCGACGAPVLT